MTDIYTIELSAKGGGTFTVPLGNAIVSFVTRYNYTVECWEVDILDAQGEMLLAGIMLVPNIDLLLPYTEIKETLGSLVLVELNADDYKNQDLLGVNTKLLWYAPGEEIVIPE